GRMGSPASLRYYLRYVARSQLISMTRATTMSSPDRPCTKYKITDDGPVRVWDQPYESVTVADIVYYDGAIWSVHTSRFPDRTDAIVVRIALDGPDGYPSAPPVLREAFSFYPAGSFQMTSMFPSKNGVYGYDTSGGRLFRLNLPTNDPNDASLQHIVNGIKA